MLDDIFIGKDSKEITKVFKYNINFLFNADLLNLPSGLIGWAKAFAGSLNQEYPKIYSGEAIICGKEQSQWAGMRIVKEK